MLRDGSAQNEVRLNWIKKQMKLCEAKKKKIAYYYLGLVELCLSLWLISR